MSDSSKPFDEAVGRICSLVSDDITAADGKINLTLGSVEYTAAIQSGSGNSVEEKAASAASKTLELIASGISDDDHKAKINDNLKELESIRSSASQDGFDLKDLEAGKPDAAASADNNPVDNIKSETAGDDHKTFVTVYNNGSRLEREMNLPGGRFVERDTVYGSSGLVTGFRDVENRLFGGTVTTIRGGNGDVRSRQYARPDGTISRSIVYDHGVEKTTRFAHNGRELEVETKKDGKLESLVEKTYKDSSVKEITRNSDMEIVKVADVRADGSGKIWRMEGSREIETFHGKNGVVSRMVITEDKWTDHEKETHFDRDGHMQTLIERSNGKVTSVTTNTKNDFEAKTTQYDAKDRIVHVAYHDLDSDKVTGERKIGYNIFGG